MICAQCVMFFIEEMSYTQQICQQCIIYPSFTLGSYCVSSCKLPVKSLNKNPRTHQPQKWVYNPEKTYCRRIVYFVIYKVTKDLKSNVSW